MIGGTATTFVRNSDGVYVKKVYKLKNIDELFQ